MEINSDEIMKVIAEAAAIHIMPRYKSLKDHEILTKSGRNDLVTAADIETEQALKDFLTSRYPGSVVIGEESVSSGEATLAALSDKTGVVWIIDPVDGTHNFVHGKRDFAVMLACVIDGKIRHGWIYDILDNSFGYAESGQGAWFNEQRVYVSMPESIRSASGHINEKYFPDFGREQLKRNSKVIDNYYTLGCTAREYLRVASGKSDFAIYSRAKPWDHFAGTLMVSEAGGVVRRWDEKPYQINDYRCGLLIAANDQLWHNLHDFFIRPMLQEQMRREK